MKIQLFNLDNDIQELHDISAQHPDIVKKIAEIMKKEHTAPQVNHFKIKALNQ